MKSRQIARIKAAFRWGAFPGDYTRDKGFRPIRGTGPSDTHPASDHMAYSAWYMACMRRILRSSFRGGRKISKKKMPSRIEDHKISCLYRRKSSSEGDALCMP